VGLAVVALLATATVARGRLYRAAVTLWGDAALRSTANARPYLNYAQALLEAGCHDAARAAVERALVIAPLDGDAAALRVRLEQDHSTRGGPVHSSCTTVWSKTSSR
jgi:hypothetical protein